MTAAAAEDLGKLGILSEREEPIRPRVGLGRGALLQYGGGALEYNEAVSSALAWCFPAG